MNDLMNPFGQSQGPQSFDKIRISIAVAGAYPLLVIRRDQKAGNHQLPHVQAGKGRSVLRPYLWSGP